MTIKSKPTSDNPLKIEICTEQCRSPEDLVQKLIGLPMIQKICPDFKSNKLEITFTDINHLNEVIISLKKYIPDIENQLWELPSSVLFNIFFPEISDRALGILLRAKEEQYIINKEERAYLATQNIHAIGIKGVNVCKKVTRDKEQESTSDKRAYKRGKEKMFFLPRKVSVNIFLT